MKKFLVIICLVAIAFVSKAQQPAGSTNSSSSTSTVNDKQCHGVTKDCPVPCTHDKTSASMTSTHNDAGAVAEKTSKKSKKKDEKTMDCCKGHTKGSCNMEESKTSTNNTSNDNQAKDAPAPSDDTTPR